MSDADWTPWDMSGMTALEESRIRRWAKGRQVETDQAKVARNKAEIRAADLQAKLDALALTTPCTGPEVHAELAIRLQAAEARARSAEDRLALFERAIRGVQDTVRDIEVPRG